MNISYTIYYLYISIIFIYYVFLWECSLIHSLILKTILRAKRDLKGPNIYFACRSLKIQSLAPCSPLNNTRETPEHH